MVFDSHLHLGQFYDRYFSPEWLVQMMGRLGITHAAVSSTTTCEEDYAKVIDEIKELCFLASYRIIPVLWVTPKMLSDSDILSMFLDCGIEWRCVKIHGAFHQGFFSTYSRSMSSTIRLAGQLKVPLLFHTGEHYCCEPLFYKKTISMHKNQVFILAHSRPVDQAIEIMKSFENTYADTAFTPIEDVVRMIEAGMEDRILWGTDVPIPIHFYGDSLNIIDYYNGLLYDLQEAVSPTIFKKITNDNYSKLFHIKFPSP